VVLNDTDQAKPLNSQRPSTTVRRDNIDRVGGSPCAYLSTLPRHIRVR